MPNERQNERYNTIPISVLCVPSSDEANDLYEAQHGQLTAFGKFGRDPLRNHEDLVQRRDSISNRK